MGITFTEDQLQKLGFYNKPESIEFDEDTIRAIFGHEAAEDETIDRLKTYYLKTSVYNGMRRKVPLLVLVGHKGVGKSALLKVLASEDPDEGRVPINVQPNDIVDLDVSKHIGDMLEIGTKHIISELYAIVLIADGKMPDYEKIQRLDFGVNIENILAQERFQGLLRTNPIDIKLSDWRNIAYHHTYRIIDKDTIVCTYGKKQQTFSISFNELLQYTHQIVKASNILNIARCIFVFDYDKEVANYQGAHAHMPVRFRSAILEENFRTSMMSMGFYLFKVGVNDDTAVAEITDLRNNGELGKDDQIMRHIHASQFLYHLWYTYEKKKVCINYYSANGRFVFSCCVDGTVCERIGRGDKELSYMAQFVSFDYGVEDHKRL